MGERVGWGPYFPPWPVEFYGPGFDWKPIRTALTVTEQSLDEPDLQPGALTALGEHLVNIR